MASLTPSAQPSRGRMLWTEWQKGFVGQSLLLWEADDSSQGPASVSGPPPLCLLELKSRDFSAPPSDSDSKTGASSLLALVRPAQPKAGCSAHFCRKKKRGHASRTSPGYHCPHLAGETTLGGPRREGERPGGWAPLAGSPFSPHLADGSAGLRPPCPHLEGGAGTNRRPSLVLPTLFGISLSDASRHSRTKPPLALKCRLCVRGSPDLKAALRLSSPLCR